MSNQKRKLPTKKVIKNYWKNKIVEMKKDIFTSVSYIDEGDYCFACGILTNTERAHIIARSIGGSDCADNLHLLCSACHKDSEILDGISYNEWFNKRTHIDTFLSVAYKVDYKFFKSFHNEIDGIDVYSIEFLHELNRLKRILLYSYN